MNKIFVLIGPTASGKSSVLKRIKDLDKIVTYTTRPKREGEVDGVDYYFCTNAWFGAQLIDNFFLETTSYNTVHGIWNYGSAKKDYEKSDKDKIIVLNYEGAKELADLYKSDPEHYAKPVLIFFDTSDIEAKRRALKRGDDPLEVDRRIKEDRLIFQETGVKQYIDYYLNAQDDINTVTNYVKVLISMEQNME